MPQQYTWTTAHVPDPLTAYLYKRYEVSETMPRPRTLRGVWCFLGYEPRRGLRNRHKVLSQWSLIFRSSPQFIWWLRSPRGLLAPLRWPGAIEEEMRRNRVFIDPVDFAAGCFPGKQRLSSLFTTWRGMPELCGSAHGCELDESEVLEACHAVRQLAEYVPFVVYARRPDLRRIPVPNTGPDLVDRLMIREAFAQDPLGVPPYAVERAIAPRWTAEIIKGLPQLPWRRQTKVAPVERSLVEAGTGGWVPSSTRPQATTPSLEAL